MTRIILRCIAVSALALGTSSIANAQTPMDRDIAAIANVGGRASTNIVIGLPDVVRLDETPAQTDVVPAVVPRRALSRAATLMVVGGAALVAGIIVGDDAGTVLILAGAGIGGYGLYLHLNNPNTRLQF